MKDVNFKVKYFLKNLILGGIREAFIGFFPYRSSLFFDKKVEFLLRKNKSEIKVKKNQHKMAQCSNVNLKL